MIGALPCSGEVLVAGALCGSEEVLCWHLSFSPEMTVTLQAWWLKRGTLPDGKNGEEVTGQDLDRCLFISPSPCLVLLAAPQHLGSEHF